MMSQEPVTHVATQFMRDNRSRHSATEYIAMMIQVELAERANHLNNDTTNVPNPTREF